MEYEYLQMTSVHKYCKITGFYKAKREDDENFILQNSQYLPATSCFFLKKVPIMFLSAM